MIQLQDVVRQYFPQEKVLNKEKVTFSDSWSGKLNNVPVSKSKYWYLKPMDMVETDKKYYFDRRQPYLYQSGLSFIVGPIAIFFALYILFTIVLTTVPFPVMVFLVMLSIILSVLTSLWNTKINQGFVNILTIKKEWVQDKKSESGETILEGEMPAGDTGYSFAHYLTQDQVNKMTFNDKLFSGRLFGNLKNMISAKFTFRYKPVTS
jgi:hypothetical protein